MSCSDARVSVVVVNYRTYAELDACLRSLERGAGVPYEIIVVDNASNAEQLAAVAARHTTACFVSRSDNPGFAAAVNDGARRAGGPFLLLLNPDGVLEPDAIGRMARFLDEHADVAVVGARAEDEEGRLERSARSFPSPLTGLFGRSSWLSRVLPNNPLTRRNLLVDEGTTSPIDVDWVHGNCLMVRADAFRAVGGMDEKFFLYWEDADLCRRIRSAGWRVVFLPSARVVHYGRRGSRHAARRSIVAFHRSAYRYFSKHQHGTRRLALPLAFVALHARLALRLAVNEIRRLRPHAFVLMTMSW